MNRGTENDAVFLQRTDIPAYQEIWLGQYKGLSGWVEKIGKNYILSIAYLIMARCKGVWLWCLMSFFNNISVLSYWSILLVDESGVTPPTCRKSSNQGFNL